MPFNVPIEPTPPPHDFLLGGGDLGALVRTFNWAATPLGPIERWPQSLRTSLSICLASRFPIVLYWGPDYIVLYNDAYSTILGSKHPWALGKPCSECWAEIWPTIGPMLDGVMLKGDATWSDDLLLELARFGYPEECYFSFSFSPVRVETGAIGGVFTAVIETTAKIIAERRLNTLRELAACIAEADSQERMLTLTAETLNRNRYDISFSVLYLLNATGDHFECKACSGIDPNYPLCSRPQPVDVTDSPFWKAVADTFRMASASIIPDLQRHLENVPIGIWGIAPVEAVALPVILPGQSSPQGCLLVGLNARKRLDQDYRDFLDLLAGQVAGNLAAARTQEEERKRIDALAELDRAKTTFFSNVSHEFRTPLTLMVGPIEAMLDRARPSVIVSREDLQLVHRNSMRLLKLVNTLLDFSRIEAGRFHAIFEATDLASLTSETASAFRSAMDQAGLEFKIDCPPLPEPAFVDRDLWEKIVLNLISNAFKFTLSGGIAVRLTMLGGFFELRIEDTGIGIPEEEQSKVFQRFHRVEGFRGRSYEGTGIGLALVQELARLHGGSIRLESTSGKGSTFIISIPRGYAHIPADRLASEKLLKSTGASASAYVNEALGWLPPGEHTVEPPAQFAADSVQAPHALLNTGRILLADDNADMREYVRRLLSDYYDVQAASNGREALEAIHSELPDLVLTDVMMPKLDGFGLLHELRARESTSTIPVILLSARAGEDARIEGMQAGADDYMVKPFTARELLARVSAHLALSRARAEAVERERALRAELEVRVSDRTAELQAANRSLQDLSWQLLRTEDDERRRIARDLHDSAGQLLTVLAINLSILSEDAKKKAPDLLAGIQESNRILQQLTEEIRTTSYLLHPPLLDESGLPNALSWYVDGLRNRTPLKIDLQIAENFGRLSPDLELAVFRLIQEAVTNIHRHSGAETATIRINRQPANLLIEIHDGGKGISSEKLIEIQSQGSGVGIRGMRERLRRFNGDLKIESAGRGTSIYVTVPVSSELSKAADGSH